MVVEIHAPHHPVEVAEAPAGETEPRDAEQSVEDLRINLQPDLTRRVVVIAGWVAHGGRSVEEEEEEHGAPGPDELGGMYTGEVGNKYVRRRSVHRW
jgi:hypothetical protein